MFCIQIFRPVQLWRGMASGDLGQQNSDQQITASVANKGQHDFEGCFRKKCEAAPEIPTSAKESRLCLHCRNQTVKVEHFKEDKDREHNIWHDSVAASLLSYWLFQFVHTNSCQLHRENVVG